VGDGGGLAAAGHAELGRMLETWMPAVLGLMYSAWAIWGVGPPLGELGEDLAFAVGEPVRVRWPCGRGLGGWRLGQVDAGASGQVLELAPQRDGPELLGGGVAWRSAAAPVVRRRSISVVGGTPPPLGSWLSAWERSR
jgi:hypothetical protein